MTEQSLRITEIFYSLQGEGRYAGLPTVFVRLTGCPLRCRYCDSEYAFFGGEKLSLLAILEQVKSFQAKFVCVTGGEPLAQPNCLPLLTQLCDLGYSVSLETSGALSIEATDQRVSRVLDLKTPASGESGRNDYSNIQHLTAHDQVKFVLCDEGDYQWAKFKLDELNLASTGAELLFSPAFNELQADQLAEWILQDRLPVRLQLQQHKYLWGDTPGH
ncbi:7-carboxy-7-deazaguanine synthase QueE [Halioxenophilus sp. WMMB6]|uniref:7-carboxy-7-deazaguanine synthase QueE n=1 Tax=Halioxenophilus sp. WMMB6 TaxID=3073815 RepID=UPI00295EA1FC|nr:7-carboxy-7-deazaguanine synthase QueE [Halioxenophilus sp. WMMB6]